MAVETCIFFFTSSSPMRHVALSCDMFTLNRIYLNQNILLKLSLFFFFFNKQNSWKASPDCFFFAATSESHVTIWWCLLANVLVILSATGLKCQVLTEEPQERTQAFWLGNMFNLQKGQYREGGISPGCSDCAEGSRAAGKTGWATGESKWLGFLWRRAD